MPFRTPPGNPNAVKRSRTPPPEDTFEEASFLKALGEKQKSVNIKLMDGQIVRGWIEYYDKNMVRLTREGAPKMAEGTSNPASGARLLASGPPVEVDALLSRKAVYNPNCSRK